MHVHNSHDVTPYESNRALQNWLGDQSAETLAMVFQMAESIYTTSSADAGAMYFMGCINTIQRIKHNCCACGVDHDAEILEVERKRMAEGIPAEDGNFIQLPVSDTDGLTVVVGFEQATGRTKCNECNHIFSSPVERFKNGPACPKCNWSPLNEM